MAEWKKDETKRMLGRRSHVCKICGTEGEFETYQVREMMQGTREEFVYFACEKCKCLQISKVPENLGDYYGENYYSMQVEDVSDIIFQTPVSSMSKVLDVGCGAGAWLLQQAASGWGNLYGCDPFLDHDRTYGDRVQIRSCSIHEMEGDGTFDIIQMSDSFEHMADPLEALKSARRLLKEDGILYMTIPTYPNIAFEKYGPHWYQLDAPRHLFLHSRESLDYLARAAGLEVFDRKYNSNYGQFVRSYFYQHGIPYWEQKPFTAERFTRKELEKLERESVIANEREYGDHMQVYWRKRALPVVGGGSKVIYQKFRREESRYAYPYPPVYREPDTDYLCFTTDAEVCSDYWKIQVVEHLDKETLEPYLSDYENRFELLQNQIQMGSAFEGNSLRNMVTVPALENLPMVKLEPEKLERTADEAGKFAYEKNPVYQRGKYGGRPLLLTVGVPVSNQIGTIERCLSHIKPLLDGLDSELVVIDTGSTDGTVEVCKRYGARVYEHPWHDNMSAVRNEAIRHARGLWYLSIDDDEWFEDVEDILIFFRTGEYKKYDYATYIQRNYMDSQGQEYGDHHTPRMALITPELHFEGRIHDALSVRGKCRQLMSYAHHYGFVNDRPDKMRAKFQRNANILIYDVYEYPEDVRYLFQLANEYKGIKSTNTALRLFVQCVSLCIQLKKIYRGRESIGGLANCLYEQEDERLFDWADALNTVFPLITAELGLNAFFMTSLAYVKERPAREIMTYFERYAGLLEEYRRDPDPAKRMTFYSLQAMESSRYISDIFSLGFCTGLRLGEEEKALELLNGFSLEMAGDKKIAVFDQGFAAGSAVFEALCGMLTPLQWEEWSETVLDAFAAGMTRYAVAQQQKQRFPEILSHLSVAAVQGWLASSELGKRDKVREKLTEYALEAAEAGRFVDGDTPLSELALCARILKEAYVKNRISDAGKQAESDEKEEASMQILKAYILAEGAFAERYYSPKLLENLEDTSLPPEIRAVYLMASALADGVANSENVVLLKQALQIYPPFYQEVRCVLGELR
ncbi:MAG: methyltransferase domain-containing protein [bacterium]|nr:methyltransferase domain-containing protein [bacterium]